MNAADWTQIDNYLIHNDALGAHADFLEQLELDVRQLGAQPETASAQFEIVEGRLVMRFDFGGGRVAEAVFGEGEWRVIQ